MITGDLDIERALRDPAYLARIKAFLRLPAGLSHKPLPRPDPRPTAERPSGPATTRAPAPSGD